MEITKQLLKKWSACANGYKWFIDKFPQGATYGEVSQALRDDKRYDDSRWLSNRMFEMLFEQPAQIEPFIKTDVACAMNDAAELLKKAASGDDSQLAASGGGSQLAASGAYSRLAASGDGSRLAASGAYSQLAASGAYSRLAASGTCSVAMSAGLGGIASAGKHGAFALAWKDGKQIRIAVGVVGENGIKPDTLYRVGETGTLEEVPA